MRKVAGCKLQDDSGGCPSFPRSVSGNPVPLEKTLDSRSTTCRNDIFKGISGSMPMHLALLFCLVMVSLSNHAHAFNQPDTGQTKCYRDVSPYDEIPCAGTGQDGAYTINPMSFTDNGNGTVTDNNTGLMWQKCSIGQNNDSTCSGTAVTYNWYRASGTYHATYNASSQDVCGSLNLGGYSDWRLPAKKELMSIVDYAIPYPGPTIKSLYFPNTISSYYWSSTTGAGTPGVAWNAHFYNGLVNYNYKHSAIHGKYKKHIITTLSFI